MRRGSEALLLGLALALLVAGPLSAAAAPLSAVTSPSSLASVASPPPPIPLPSRSSLPSLPSIHPCELLPLCAPGVPPPGANDPACVASKPPVILVHGTFADMTQSWPLFAPLLEQSGYCVWALDLPERGTVDVEQSVQVLAAFTHHVLDVTHAPKVSLIGHSLGGLQIRHLLKHAEFGLGDRVDDAISLGGSHFGTATPLAPFVGPLCDSCIQQEQGSDFYTQHMNVGDLTPGSASYTQIETMNDEVVTPYTNALLPEEPGVVSNVVLQKVCLADASEHIALLYDLFAVNWALDALSHAGPADLAHAAFLC